MINPNLHVAELISLFNQTPRYHHRYEVFRDFVHMAACAVHKLVNSVPLNSYQYGAVCALTTKNVPYYI